MHIHAQRYLWCVGSETVNARITRERKRLQRFIRIYKPVLNGVPENPRKMVSVNHRGVNTFAGLNTG